VSLGGSTKWRAAACHLRIRIAGSIGRRAGFVGWSSACPRMSLGGSAHLAGAAVRHLTIRIAGSIGWRAGFVGWSSAGLRTSRGGSAHLAWAAVRHLTIRSARGIRGCIGSVTCSGGSLGTATRRGVVATLTAVASRTIEVASAIPASVGTCGGEGVGIRNVYVILIGHMMVVPVSIPAMPSPGLARQHTDRHPGTERQYSSADHFTR
jgi:hypothetical protein